jgi:hypothetical protein
MKDGLASNMNIHRGAESAILKSHRSALTAVGSSQSGGWTHLLTVVVLRLVDLVDWIIRCGSLERYVRAVVLLVLVVLAIRVLLPDGLRALRP